MSKKQIYVLCKINYPHDDDCEFCMWEHSNNKGKNRPTNPDPCDHCATPPVKAGEVDNFKLADKFSPIDIIEAYNRINELECEVYELVLAHKKEIKYKNDVIEELITELKECDEECNYGRR